MSTKITFSFIFLVAALISTSRVTFSQQKDAEIAAAVVEPNGGECELNSAHIRDILSRMEEKNHRLHIVSRLGNNERSKSLHQRRIHNAKVVLGKNTRAIEGERVNGLGRLEFYLDNQLVLTSIIRQGKDICLTCCDADYRLYPWRAMKKRSR